MKPTFATTYSISTLTASALGWIGLFIVFHAIGLLIMADYNDTDPNLIQFLIQFVMGCCLIGGGIYTYQKALKAEAKAKQKETYFQNA